MSTEGRPSFDPKDPAYLKAKDETRDEFMLEMTLRDTFGVSSIKELRRLADDLRS